MYQPHANARMEGRRPAAGIPPQHLLLQQQQPPGVIMPMPNHPVQILQNQHNHGHYSNQNSYQQNQGSSYVPSQPPPPSYHQQGPVFRQTNPPAVNHSKGYRKDYNVFNKDQVYGTSKEDYSNQEANFSSNNKSSYKGQKISQKESTGQSNMAENEKEPKKESESTTAPDSTTTEDTSSSTTSMMIKEKTPMCLVNELARFNKITHQYRLTDEQGPAHKKSFTVMLTLGHEEYTAEGPSIKKAQHAAAAEALTKTAYPHPSPKTNRHATIGKPNMTPTVELNALAMKRGEPTIYKLIDPPHPPMILQPQSYNFRRPYGIRGAYFRRGRANQFMRGGGARIPFRLPFAPPNVTFKVSLKVGETEFFGEGNSLQAARHDAASKALNHLRLLPLPENCPVPDSTSVIDSELDSSIKSPISLVHETALKRNLNVIFKVISEKGPPHMKTFITECIVGDLKAVGEGNGKKVSKKRAAENMLSELKKLPPLSPTLAATISLNRLKRKPAQTKKKSRNLIKITQETKSEPETCEEINPISRLIQIQQVKKEKEPVYTLLEEKGAHRRREFVMEVTIGQLKAVGSGPNKKIAKRYAAQNLLALFEGGTSNVATSNNQPKRDHLESKPKESTTGRINSNRPQSTSTNVNLTSNESTSKPIEGDSKSQKSSSQNVIGPKGQLIYLAGLMHFDVQFSDYPKANHSEYLTLVSLSTNPPQVCHGSGATIEESHDEAASKALRALSEMGLDSVSSKESKTQPQSQKSDEEYLENDRNNPPKNR